MTRGLAPGNCARTTICGGATSGYSETGSWTIASTPSRKMKIEMTPAKRGRSMKKREMSTGGLRSGLAGGLRVRGLVGRRFLAVGRLRCAALRIAGRRAAAGTWRSRWRCRNRHALVVDLQDLRRHRHPGHHPLQPVDDDVLARLHAALHDAHAVDQRARLDLAKLRLAVRADDVDELLRLVGADRAIGDQHRVVRGCVLHPQLRAQPGREQALRVIEARPQADRAGLRIEPVVDEVDLAGVRKALLVGEAETDARRLGARACRSQPQEGLLAAVEVSVDLV